MYYNIFKNNYQTILNNAVRYGKAQGNGTCYAIVRENHDYIERETSFELEPYSHYVCATCAHYSEAMKIIEKLIATQDNNGFVSMYGIAVLHTPIKFNVWCGNDCVFSELPLNDAQTIFKNYPNYFEFDSNSIEDDSVDLLVDEKDASILIKLFGNYFIEHNKKCLKEYFKKCIEQ